MSWILWKLLWKLAVLMRVLMQWLIIIGVIWYLATQAAHAVMGW